jgi:glucan phosphoethanolaminetransferase (alkaline phosphatase superfamily)
MLSPVSSSHFSIPPKEGFIIEAFNFLGFHTALFSTNDIRETDKVISNIYKSFNEYHNYRYKHDEIILPKLGKFLKEGGNNLIVLHSAGSHFQYYDRYPKKFEVFKPACLESIYGCDKETVDNVYDNTIYYTDYIISQIINKFKDTNTILFFVPDHGESLGEYGIYKHGIPLAFAPEAQRYTPFFVWVSDQYKKNYPIKARNLLTRDNSSQSS